MNGTRWGRSTVMMLGALSVVAGIVGLNRADVVALTMTYQGSAARFSTDAIRGEDVAIGVSEATIRSSAGVDTKIKVLRAGFAVAEMDRLCLSIQQDLPILGTVTLRVESSDDVAGTYEVKAQNVELDILRGRSASGAGINLNGNVKIGMATQDLTTVAGVDDPLQQPMDNDGSGYWGLDATQGSIANLSGLLYDVEIVGSIQLPNLKISTNGAPCPIASQVVN